MRVTEKMKKLLSILLCLCMLLQNAPVMAFAATTDNLCEHHPEHTAECHYAEAVAGVECAHECGEECAEGCVHTAHDDLCGYIEAVEAHDCHYECAECANNELSSRTSPQTGVAIPEGDAQNQEIATSAPDGDLLAMTEAVCNCGTDDPAIHATTCAVYVAPENPQCFCAEKCTEANVWCDVCGFDVTACTGTDTAAAFADGDDLAISGAWMSSSTPYLASGSKEASATQPETGGYAYWDAASNTLTLNNFTSATDAATGIFYDGSAETLCIELVGNNSVTGGTAPSTATRSGVGLFNTNTNIIFSEGGTLTVTGNNGGYGVDATGGNITVDSGTTLIATGVWSGCGVCATSITVNAGGSLTGNGGESGGDGVSASSGIIVNAGGSLTGNGGESGGDGVFAAGTGGITVNAGGSLTGNGGESGGHGVYAYSGSITVNGGSLTGNSSDSRGVDADSITVENGGILEATGKDTGVYVGGTRESGGSITVNGGSLTAKGEKFGVYTYPSSISVSGDSHILATGGSSGNEIPVGNLPEDYYYYASGDGTDKTFTHSADALLTGTVYQRYFELVTAQHLSDTYTSNGDATHSRYCSCALHTKVTAPEACSGGTATCTTLAVCDICKTAYGELGGHTYNTAGSCTVCGAACPHSNFDSATGNCKDCEISLAIAKVETGETTTYYQTADDLRTAVLESGDDQTITLLADFAVIGDLYFHADGTENTLDLNGHTLICSDPIMERILVNYCELTIAGTGSINIFMSADSEGSKIVVGSGVTLNDTLRSVYGGVLDLTNATIPEAGLNVILYSDDSDPTTYNVSDVLLLPEDYYFFVDGKAVSSYSGETVGTVLKHTDHSYTYTDNGDGTHDKACSVCGDVVMDNENHTLTYTVDGNTITESCSANCGYSETATISAEDTTYNGTEQKTAAVTYSDGWKSDELNVSYENNVNAGTATASITVGEVTASVDFTITKSTVTITADAKSKHYGTENPTLTYTSEGLLGDDALTGALETTATKTSNVGEYDITVGSLANSNYTIDFVGAKLTITRAAAPEIQWPTAAALTYGRKLSDSALTSQDKNGTFAWQDGSIVPTVKNNGYVVVYTPKDTDNYDYTVVELTETIPVTVSKGQATVTAAPTPNKLAYTGEAQYLISAGEANGGTMQYSTDNQTWSTTIPQGTAAGEYTVYYKVVGDANHSDTAVDSVEVTIARAQAVITVDTTTITVTYGDTVNLPKATTNFGTVVCDKTADDLVNAGTYTVTYTVVGTGNFEGATKTLTVKIEQLAVAEPTVTGTYTYIGSELTAQLTGLESCMTIASGNKGTNAGSYEVRITLDGNHKWADGSDGKVQWSIAKAQATITVDTDPITVTYGEAVQLPVASSNFGTVSCDKQASDLVNAGTYTVTYTVAGTNNFDGDTRTLTVTVAKKTVAEPTVSGTYTYTGSGQTVTLDGFDGEYMTIVSGNTGTNAADYEVVITLDGNHQWADDSDGKVTWTIAPASLETAVITLDQTTYIYDGQSHYPAVTVTLDGRKLAEGTDYKVIYMRPRMMVNGKPTKWFGDHTISEICIDAHDDYYAVVLGLGNYYTEDAFTLYQNFVIQPRPLTIKAADQTILRYASINRESISIIEGSLLQGHTLTGWVLVQNVFDEGQNVETIVGTHTNVLYIDEVSVVIKAGEEAVTGNYSITQEKGTLTVVEHTHQWSYTASGDTITAKCEGTIGRCDVETVIIKLNAPADLSYNGSEKSVTVTQNPAGILPDVPAVEYQGDRKATGDHTAKLTMGGATAQLTFTITCEHSFQAGEYLWNADNTACTVTGTCEKGCGATTEATASVSSRQTTAPTCEEKGETTYTATFEADWAETQNKTVADIPMLNDVVIPDDIQGGNASVDNETPATGDKVTVTVTPDIGKEVDKITVKDENGEEVPVTKNEDGSYTYEQPAGDVTIDVNMKDTEYKVDIPETEGGKAETDKDAPIMGDKVTVTVTPDIGKEVDEITVTDKDGNEIPVTKNEDGTYTYEQPAGDVTIDVTMKDTKYDVQIPETEGGKVETDKDSPILGDEVTITVTPDKGQKVENITVTDKDGNSIPVTDNGDGTYTYEQPVGNVTVEVEFGIDSIQVVPEGENPFQAGHEVQIDGITVPVDSVGEVWLKNTGSKLMTTHTYSTNEEGWQYPTGMQVWYLNWNDKDGDGELDHCDAIPVSELENYMTYQGTSIRIGGSSDGIRFFTAVPTEVNNKLMQGQLLTGMLEGYKLVEMGTLYAKAVSGRELTTDNGVESYVYGGDAGTSFRVFSQSGDASWYTGMLVGLEGNAATLDMDIISRPYAVLESEDGERVTIYGGSIVRSVYDVALQNQDTWASGTAYDNYVEKIISTVEAAKG